MNANDPYQWGRHIFDGPALLESFWGLMRLGGERKKKNYLFVLAEQLLGVGVFNIHERLSGSE